MTVATIDYYLQNYLAFSRNAMEYHGTYTSSTIYPTNVTCSSSSFSPSRFPHEINPFVIDTMGTSISEPDFQHRHFLPWKIYPSYPRLGRAGDPVRRHRSCSRTSPTNITHIIYIAETSVRPSPGDLRHVAQPFNGHTKVFTCISGSGYSSGKILEVSHIVRRYAGI
jgi:hypothetical protein